jgi:hypothetical protein
MFRRPPGSVLIDYGLATIIPHADGTRPIVLASSGASRQTNHLNVSYPLQAM